jgi:hypothetical protein
MSSNPSRDWLGIVNSWAGQRCTIEHTQARGAFVTATVKTGEHRYFCKAAPVTAPSALQDLRIETIATNAHRQAAAPFYGQLRGPAWEVLVFDHIDGEHPSWHPPAQVFALFERIADLTKFPGGRPDIKQLPAVIDRINAAPDWEILVREHPWLVHSAAKDYLIDGQAERMRHLTGTHIAHTDIHPGNVLVNDDRIRVIDWGWAATAPNWFDQAVIGVQLVNAGVRPDTMIESICSDLTGHPCTPESLRAFAIEMGRYWIGRYLNNLEARHLLNLILAANRMVLCLDGPAIVHEPALGSADLPAEIFAGTPADQDVS